MGLLPRLFRSALCLTTTLAIALSSGSALAAEKVVLTYRIFRQSISVEEMSTFAQKGELSSSLRVNLALARQDPKVIRRYLTESVTVNPVLLDRVLNSPVGNIVLDEISQAIHTPSRRADRQALRAALVLSAAQDYPEGSANSDRNISLIEVIENYPAAEVIVDGDRLERAYRQLRQFERGLPDLLRRISI
ncbi:alpha/beta hydrolase [Aliterella atlantica]|uniref:DUF1400 domain-containing protein n=1 Tax=Aliterella atlantica CENA595 TaxID=1618023 RepID=A0A0D8ZQ69_9CYAN|nr:alpha/beta hydrolase [Aliterella atlantica]KJH70958.1 hypothetical protein UH38_15330 [Aliterella atlantica CENA595]